MKTSQSMMVGTQQRQNCLTEADQLICPKINKLRETPDLIQVVISLSSL